MSDNRKTVLITGAGVGGIGGALAKEFHLKGYRVFATARRIETIAPLAEEFGIETLPLDVTSQESVDAAKKEIVAATGGKLDVLVNNAGISYTMPATDLEIDTVKELFDVNVFGVMRMVKAFADVLVEARGVIANVGSIASIMPFVFGSSYNATKGALHSYGNTLRVEMRPFGVKVLTIVTGGVKSQIARWPRTLPENSLYLPINDDFQLRLSRSQRGAMDTDEYAKGVVQKIRNALEGGRWSVWYWRGNFSFWAWCIDTFLWKGVWDSLMMGRFGLKRMQRIHEESRKRLEAGKKSD
ncbi:NADPH-dependent 1-acyl dihydroxyacetone phosphate reductase [Rhizina undulata]